MADYYAILGVPRGATPTEIRDAYLQLARDTHPDRVKDPEARKKAEDIFKNVTAAYDTLSKDRSRRDYTSKLPASDEPAVAPRKPPMVQAPQPPPLTPRSTPTQAPQTPAGTTPGPQPPAATSGRASFDALGQGIEAYKKQDYHTAVQMLNIAVSQDEGSAKAHGMLAMAMAKNPNWVRDAMQHMETATKLDPKNVSYQVELALLLQSAGLKLRAKRALETALALAPDHPDVARALKEIPLAPPAPANPLRNTAETARGLFDRLRKR